MPTHFREQLTLHTFTLILDGLDVADETTLDAFYEAGASDALFGQRDMIQFADFDREAGDLVGAITSAIEQVESVEGIRVLRVEPEDLVSASAIAERTGRTRESVRLLIEGERGPGEFPPPVAWVDAKTRLWHWSDVANWFSDKFDQRVDDVDDAQLIAALNASLETRNRLATLERTEHRVAVAHIVADSRPFTDRKLERDYVYARALASRLPDQSAERLDLGSEVELTHLRIAQTHEGSGSLEEGGGEVVAIFSGKGPQHEAEQARLSTIVDVINDRFGLDLDDTDQLLFDQFEESWAADATLVARARTNDYDNFLLVFDETFVDTIVKRVDSNEAIFKKILDEPGFRQTVLEYYAGKLYERLRRPDDQLGLAPAPA